MVTRIINRKTQHKLLQTLDLKRKELSSKDSELKMSVNVKGSNTRWIPNLVLKTQ